MHTQAVELGDEEVAQPASLPPEPAMSRLRDRSA
jgi:hypothetical protein